MRIGNKGFSLSELIVGMVVAAIVILMVGAIGTIAYKSYKELREISDVYADAHSALQMVRENVRQATTTPVIAGSCLTLTVFGSTKSIHTQGNNLVYGNSCGATTSTLIANMTNLVFTPSLAGEVVTLALSGEKAGVDIGYSIKAKRRNP